MMEVNSLLFMVLCELLLVFFGFSLLMIVWSLLRKRRERAAIQKLLAIVKQDEERRRQETRELLETRYGYSGEQLEAQEGKILREEKRLYQTLINLFVMRDAAAMENLNIAFEGAIEPYRELEIPERQVEGQEVETGVDAAEDSAELQRLQEENQRLSEELQVTMNTMGRMLSEYSSMFGGGGETPLDKEKLLEMFQEDSAEEVTQGAADEPVGETLEKSAEEPGENTREVSAEEETDEPVGETLENSAEEPGENTREVSAEEEADESSDPDGVGPDKGLDQEARAQPLGSGGEEPVGK